MCSIIIYPLPRGPPYPWLWVILTCGRYQKLAHLPGGGMIPYCMILSVVNCIHMDLWSYISICGFVCGNEHIPASCRSRPRTDYTTLLGWPIL